MKHSSSLLNEILRLKKEAEENPKPGVDYEYLIGQAKREYEYVRLGHIEK